VRTAPHPQRDVAGDSGHIPFDRRRRFPDRLKTYPTTRPWRRTSSLSNSQVSNRVADRATGLSVGAHGPRSATGSRRGFGSWAVRWTTSIHGQLGNLSYDQAVATNFQFVECPSGVPRCTTSPPEWLHGSIRCRRSLISLRNGLLNLPPLKFPRRHPWGRQLGEAGEEIRWFFGPGKLAQGKSSWCAGEI